MPSQNNNPASLYCALVQHRLGPKVSVLINILLQEDFRVKASGKLKEIASSQLYHGPIANNKALLYIDQWSDSKYVK